MEINDPKQAAIVATSIRIFCALGPLMGTQGLSDSDSEKLQNWCQEINDAATQMVVERIGPSIDVPGALSDEEMMEWSWILDVLSHVGMHAEKGRATYERMIQARIAAQN